MAQPVNVIILTIGVLQGGLLGLYLLRKQKPNLQGLYFVFILLLAGLQLTFKVISKVWLWENIKLAYLMSYSLPYLAGPLLYLYISARAKRPFTPADLLHLVPFFISIAVCIAQHIFPYEFIGFYIHPYLAASLQVLSIATYAGLSWRLIQAQEMPGLKSFVLAIAGSEAIISLALAVMYLYHPQLQEIRWVFVILTLFMYWVSYRLMEPGNQFQEPKSSKAAKYIHSSLKEEEAIHIAVQLKRIMSSDRLFTDAELNIDTLARQLNTSRHHVSQVINERFGQRYHEFINEFRLAEARARLESGRYDHYTVSAIALDCGFGTVSNFNELFKRRYGITPSQVRLQLAVKADS